MFPDSQETATDDSLIHAIQTIHRLGMKVMLKPHIAILESEQWRGKIEPTDERLWFENYRVFITHYAKLAQANNVEMLSIGTELSSMTQQRHTTYWLAIIDGIKQVYWGELTYAANWSSDATWQEFGFWEELDYVGIDAYFPLTRKVGPTSAELKSAWQTWVAQIEARQKMIEKKIVLTEIGYRDIDGANTNPGDGQMEGRENQNEQASCYEAALEAFWGKPWLQGIFWWAWMPDQRPRDYTSWGKLAETILRSWYAKPFIPVGIPDDAADALVSIQKAESEIDAARRENRTGGLTGAQSLLVDAIVAYDSGDFSQSRTLASNAKEMAASAVDRRKYDEAEGLIGHVLQKLDSLRDVMRSEDAITLVRQADTELTMAREALARSNIEKAKEYATESMRLLQEASETEHRFEAQQQARQQRTAILHLTALLVVPVVAVSVALCTRAAHKPKRQE